MNLAQEQLGAANGVTTDFRPLPLIEILRRPVHPKAPRIGPVLAGRERELLERCLRRTAVLIAPNIQTGLTTMSQADSAVWCSQDLLGVHLRIMTDRLTLYLPEQFVREFVSHHQSRWDGDPAVPAFLGTEGDQTADTFQRLIVQAGRTRPISDRMTVKCEAVRREQIGAAGLPPQGLWVFCKINRVETQTFVVLSEALRERLRRYARLEISAGGVVRLCQTIIVGALRTVVNVPNLTSAADLLKGGRLRLAASHAELSVRLTVFSSPEKAFGGVAGPVRSLNVRLGFDLPQRKASISIDCSGDEK